MLRILVPCRIETEHRAEALAVYAELIRATREEAGCLSYELLADVEDPAAFVLAECWRSEADLEAHTRTPHFREAMAALEPLETAANAQRLRAVEFD
ncbi:hypothetical protein FM113_06145 [Leucobacter sp. 7(1)]|uniref:putative quinol monooxygenase n=1 Tax=Leucobacter sp. 7(1) TaxID=1255613 RepID=UPI00097F25C2|nr:putative quinol monooxygenase [Leucobacter sp. 7(1)]SJN09426.1 hypothetical protein FM113_06145 [Leucobacter sp. 7(1)]